MERAQMVIKRKDCPDLVMEWMWVVRGWEGPKISSRFTKPDTQVGLWFPQ